MRKSVKEWWRSVWWYWLLLGLLFAAGIGLLFLYSDTKWDLAHSLGEAFVVAVVLALSVDYAVKRRLANEVRRDVFLAILGRHAPDWYVTSLLEALGRGLAAESCSWQICLHPRNSEPDSVLVKFRVQHQGQNLAPRAIAWPEHWLPLNDPHLCEFTSFVLVTSITGTSPPSECRFDVEQLRSIGQREANRIVLDLGRHGVHVPAECESFESTLEGQLVLGVHDLFPIVVRFPTRHMTLSITNRSKLLYILQLGLVILERVDSSKAAKEYQMPPEPQVTTKSVFALDFEETAPLNPGTTIMLRIEPPSPPVPTR